MRRSINFRGDCLVVIRLAERRDYNRSAILDELTRLSKAMAYLASDECTSVRKVQKSRALSDFGLINDIIRRVEKGERLAIVRRQYVGHRYTPDKVDNMHNIIQLGRFIWWR